MEQNLLQQQCQSHKQEVVAFDLDPLAELKDRYFCLDCLATPTPYRQIKITRDAQQQFKEMTIFAFNNKKKQITQDLAQLQVLHNKIEEFQEFFKSKISESIQILNQRIQEVQNELNTLIEPSHEIQNEQDLINLSNYVNYGFNQNPNNEKNPKNYEFINQIKQQLDYQKFEEYLVSISNQLQSITTSPLIDEQINLITSAKLQIDFKKHTNLRYQCQKHKSEIIMIYLEPGQIDERFFCQNCIKENNQQQLKTIQDVNKLWQVHQQKINISNQNFYDLRQNNQNIINELIVQYQKFSQELFNELLKQIINQNNKIVKEKNDSQFSILNKQLYQMELEEIQFITQTLSQNNPMEKILQKQFQTSEEDKIYKNQILEQLNLQRKKLMEITLQINQLFQFDLIMNERKDDNLEQQFSQKIFPQFYDNYLKFNNQYKLIINYTKSKFEKFQIQNNSQQSNHQKETKALSYQQILESMQQIEKVWLKQVSLSTQNRYNQFKLQIKRSQNNLTTQNLHIKQKYPLRRNLRLMINKISDHQEIQYNSYFIFRKHLQFSDKLKHSIISLCGNRKITSNPTPDGIYAICLCDLPIPVNGFLEVDFKINKLVCIMIGMCKSKFIKQDFNFDNFAYNLHGLYVLRYDSYVYSHDDQSKNYKQLGFRFNENDIINVEVNNSIKQIIWRNKTKRLQYSLEFSPSKDLHFCCVLYPNDKKKNEVEII